MSIRSKLVAALLCYAVVAATLVYADGISDPNGKGGVIGFTDGINNLGIGGGGGGGGSCAGAVDLTQGCALPMLGGVP